MNSSLISRDVIVHPTKNSVHLFEILQGKFSYVKGQTLYAGLRSSSILARQLFIHLYTSALNSISYDDLLGDWLRFESSFKQKWDEQAENPVFKKTTFQSWASTLKLTIEKKFLNIIHHVVYSKLSLSYEKYVDWVMATGLVPLAEATADASFINSVTAMLAQQMTAVGDDGIKSIAKGLISEVKRVVTALSSHYIPDYTEVVIQYTAKGFKAFYKGKPIKVIVFARPTVGNADPIFDSPLQRLSAAVMQCYRTQEHVKLCQLINTAPVRGVVSQQSNSDLYKDILNRLDESAQKNNPKKELLQLLVKLAENKTVNGVTDVVEEFITDVSQNMVDKSKLFGGTMETTKQTLKKQVSGSVFKCLTNQINEQFETINNLQKEREMFVKRIELLESKVLRDAGEGGSKVPTCIITGDTFASLRDITDSDVTHKFIQLERGGQLHNSFLTQFVPPVDNLLRDLTALWENEILQTYKLTPIVDNQGQRLYVKYSQDTVSLLIGPFVYVVAGLTAVELITDHRATVDFQQLAEEIYKTSRLAIYIGDVGVKYCSQEQEEDERRDETPNWGFLPHDDEGYNQQRQTI